jgi:general secretion pathway protein E
MSNDSIQLRDVRARDGGRRPQGVEVPAPPRRGSILLRSLGVDPAPLTFDHLGMGDSTRAALIEALAGTPGVVLAAGPPGSGRTTTTYAAVEQIRNDPKIMLTSGELFVPEIRDNATAELAMQGALAGCLVVSTIQAAHAGPALRRLISFGMPPSFLAVKLQAIVAQRLVRMVCHGCREETSASNAVFDSALPQIEWRGSGCDRCLGTGYRGRTGIFQILLMDESCRSDLVRFAAGEGRSVAFNPSGPGLFEDGLRQVRAGVTTVEEVLRVTAVDRRKITS